MNIAKCFFIIHVLAKECEVVYAIRKYAKVNCLPFSVGDWNTTSYCKLRLSFLYPSKD